MATIQIRPLAPADWDQIRPMLLDMGFVDDPAGLAERFPTFCAHPDWALLGAFEGKTLLGYAAAQDYGPHLRSGRQHQTAKLHDLYTQPEHRRQGVGRALMQGVEAWGRARDLRYIEWYANTREASPAYAGMGYVGAPSGQDGFLYFEIGLRPVG